MTDCTPMPPGRGGWSEWHEPIMKGYRMQCCDCGLIHEVQFKVLEQLTDTDENGAWKAKPFKRGRFSWRLRRAMPSKQKHGS